MDELDYDVMVLINESAAEVGDVAARSRSEVHLKDEVTDAAYDAMKKVALKVLQTKEKRHGV